GAALHREGGARMVRQHEDRAVIRRVVAPPALPALVRPRPAHRPEHVATENPCADIGKAARREIIVSAGIPAILSEHRAERAGRDGPFMQRHPANAERVVEALAGAGPIAVERYREAADAQFRHWGPFNACILQLVADYD